MKQDTTMPDLPHSDRATRFAWPARALGALVLGALGASAVHARGQEEPEPDEAGPPVPQEQDEPQEQPDDDPEIVNPLGGGMAQDDPRQQMIDLFHTVERNLQAVDLQLMQAGTGVLPLEAPADAGLDDLLQEALERSRQVTDEIDRMLELAQQMNSMQQQQQSQSSQQGQQGQPSQGQPGESPLDERQRGGEQGREQTPEGPREDGGDQQGQEQQGDQQGQDQEGQGDQEQEGQEGDPNQDPNGTNSDGDEDNPEGGQNRPGEEQGGERGPGSRPSDDAERWGELPVRVREVFRNQGREDLPVQYRDWIDAYYRRLNRGDG